MREISRIIRHMTPRETLKKMLDRHCEATGLAPATVATKAVNDGKFFDRIFSGGGFTTDTYARAIKWFEDNAPKGATK